MEANTTHKRSTAIGVIGSESVPPYNEEHSATGCARARTRAVAAPAELGAVDLHYCFLNILAEKSISIS
tara:strand:+ start:6801 stop:7007 length:207 start_codon:yes stop_codon:yes gene_type:complete